MGESNQNKEPKAYQGNPYAGALNHALHRGLDIGLSFPPDARINYIVAPSKRLPKSVQDHILSYQNRRRRGRPEKDPRQRSIAKDLWGQGKGLEEIVGNLAHIFGEDDGAKRNTVWKWTKEFKEEDGKDPLAKPLSWFAHEALIDLKPENFEFVNDIQTLIGKYPMPFGVGKPLTARQAFWCMRVSQWAPTLKNNKVDVYIFGALIAARQEDALQNNRWMETLDVERFLQYEPWKKQLGRENERRYISDCDTGKIPKLRLSSHDLGWYDYVQKKIDSHNHKKVGEKLHPYDVQKAFSEVHEHYWYELPSKQLDKIIRRLGQ